MLDIGQRLDKSWDTHIGNQHRIISGPVEGPEIHDSHFNIFGHSTEKEVA